jgi:hypothetical protein
MASAQPKIITIRLVCTSMPETPFEEGLLDVGLQDKAQAVHPGRVHKDGTTVFACALEAILVDGGQAPGYRGPFVHGTPDARFLYLSWKRRAQDVSPWYWRVKIPLAGITWKQLSSLKANEVLEANIGRRPHATEPIAWKPSSASAT